MNWQAVYKDRLTTAQEAVQVVKSGDRVVLGHACSEPIVLSDALISRADELTDVEIVYLVPMSKSKYCTEGMEKHFFHNGLFAGGQNREFINLGRADFTPCFFSEVPRLFLDGYLPVDVAMIQVTSPDEHGFCSFGVSIDYTKAAASCAKIVIAEVNPNMPRTLGNSFIHVSEITHIVEADYEIIEMPARKNGGVEEAIGRHVASLVEDRSTLQLGIGAIPDAVLLFLRNKKDLGIHTEMFSDGVVELVEAGVINNKAKTLHPGKMIATFLMGTRKLYNFVDNNPMVEMHCVSYTNDPYVISRNDKMISINSALQVDLTGQICADTLGYMQYSGVGGQVDYVRGATRSRGGKAIIALPSTAAGGKISRIVSILDEGAMVTTSRSDTHYVVTEYGIANLRGKSLRERARALITIAHPDFRAELTKELAKTRNLVL